MKVSQLKNIIKEQIKQVKQDLSREKINPRPINYSGGGTRDPQRADQKKFIGSDDTSLSTTYMNSSSASTAAFWLCLYIPGPHGTGSGCYGFDQFGVWTSPLTGAQATSNCLPWHMGGNCFAAQHTQDFPVTVNTSNGPQVLTSPPEKACAPNCLHS